MLTIKEINKKEARLCYELDLKTICLWSKKQWESEFNKKGIKVFGLFLENKIIGICSLQIIIDEAQLNYFSINASFRRKGYGSYLMRYLIDYCEKSKVKKLLLEYSEANLIAKNFYKKFKFCIVGRRKNYFRNGYDAILKEKILIK